MKNNVWICAARVQLSLLANPFYYLFVTSMGSDFVVLSDSDNATPMSTVISNKTPFVNDEVTPIQHDTTPIKNSANANHNSAANGKSDRHWKTSSKKKVRNTKKQQEIHHSLSTPTQSITSPPDSRNMHSKLTVDRALSKKKSLQHQYGNDNTPNKLGTGKKEKEPNNKIKKRKAFDRLSDSTQMGLFMSLEDATNSKKLTHHEKKKKKVKK
ncbi:hypothetical protein RFI_17768 [Reticulomyxa filosa]|uniref:Uncharacterized protein n=1 Tax=Reticulomyxa filosa TaxID=46433 RepID=X6N088_RETFI|nr:hypothetical protein RFI_17768 [Reticulomyxa filosa]|eukprot:ETO19461.1 hypothetical protein RFI_17768 [Reticulomyxa filosa]